MSSIKLKHSGGNSVIIAAPSSNPASDRTLTVPSNADGTILTTTNPKAGNIIQVKQARLTSGSFTTSSTSYVDITGLSVEITPTSSSSKILVLVQGGEWGHYTGGAYTSYMKILRDSTAITGDNKVNAREGSGNAVGNASFSILDSPNTTSAVTYKGQARTDDSSKTVYVQNGDNGNISITVMEVAA
jgi:hypothetical protein